MAPADTAVEGHQFDQNIDSNNIAMALLLVTVFYVISACGAVTDVNPFVNGTFQTDSFDIPHTNDSSLHSLVVYPTTPGTYPFYFFVPGFRGILPSSMYTVYLRGIASHGFVTVSTDHMDVDQFEEKVRHFMARFELMKANINAMLVQHISGVKANMDNITLGSHSAGADINIAMMKINHKGIKATVFLEPMVMYLNTTIPFGLPAVMFGTQLSEEGSGFLFPPCVFPQYDFRHVYNNWLTPKIQMEAKSYGHCDIMDPEGRNMCSELHLCKMNATADLTAYQLYLQGLTTGFLNWVLHNQEVTRYLTDPSLAPITLINLKFQGL